MAWPEIKLISSFFEVWQKVRDPTESSFCHVPGERERRKEPISHIVSKRHQINDPSHFVCSVACRGNRSQGAKWEIASFSNSKHLLQICCKVFEWDILLYAVHLRGKLVPSSEVLGVFSGCNFLPTVTGTKDVQHECNLSKCHMKIPIFGLYFI